jgi:hypothetical protein
MKRYSRRCLPLLRPQNSNKKFESLRFFVKSIVHSSFFFQALKNAPPTTGSCILIAFKTNQKAGIVLSRFRQFSLPELRRAVTGNELDLDQLRALQSLFPLSQQEHALLSHYKGAEIIFDPIPLFMLLYATGDVAALQPVERFYLEFLAVPRIEQRIAMLIFLRSFPQLIRLFFGWLVFCFFLSSIQSSLSDISRGIAIISEACDELRSSQRVKQLLKKVVKIGRKLTGDAQFSFSVSALLKMNDTKVKKQPTLV